VDRKNDRKGALLTAVQKALRYVFVIRKHNKMGDPGKEKELLSKDGILT